MTLSTLHSDEYKFEAPILYSIYFCSEKVGWIGGYQGIFYTNNGGGTWQRLPITVGSISRYREGTSDEQVGKILWADETRVIIRSHDGLLHANALTNRWQDVPLSWQILTHIKDMTFAEENRGWAIDWEGNIYATSDGGKTWKARAKKILSSPTKILAKSSRELWAIGANGMIGHTADGNETWQVQKLHPDANDILTSVQFINETQGWITSIDGSLFQTRDGGQNWSRLNLVTGKRIALEKVSFVNDSEGWIIGAISRKEVVGRDAGVIIHTNDGGIIFQIQLSSIDDYPIDVLGLKNGNAWVTGVRGKVLHTDNFGKSWVAVQLQTGREGKGKKKEIR